MRENLTRHNNSFPAFRHRKTAWYKICAGRKSDCFHCQVIAKPHDLIFITNTLKKKSNAYVAQINLKALAAIATTPKDWEFTEWIKNKLKIELCPFPFQCDPGFRQVKICLFL